MIQGILFALTIVTISLASCTTSKQSIIPLDASIELDDAYTIIWHGKGEAYRYNDGQWLRAKNYDYQFNVTQKRYDNYWKSTKSLHRIHPDYDGKAGARNQTMYFEVKYQNLKDSLVQALIYSSLGNGTGTTDKEFRKAQLVMFVENPSLFLPYNKFRITQHYNYEAGVLTETVELIKEKDGEEIPFMKNVETAYFFIRSKLGQAPTIFKQ